MALDTIVVEPDEDRLTQTWRGSCNVHGKIHDIGTIRINSNGFI